MIPVVRKAFHHSAVHGQNFQLFVAAKRDVTVWPKHVRTLVSWSTCSCVLSPHEKKTNGMRKSFRLLNSSNLVPSWSSQSSSISTSNCFPTAGAAQAQRSMTVDENAVEWDLFAGIVVERKPVITSNKNEIEEKYAKFLAQLEFETSKKSDHETRHEKDLKMLEKVKAGEIDLGNVQTARDEEDRWNAEAQSFQPTSRETDADRKNDIRSLDRALDSHLLLVVEQKLGEDHRWICPHSKLEKGETLRQAAERMLREVFPDMKTKILGHAPWGFYKYKYPISDTVKTPATGAKVFFYKAQVVSGETSKVDGDGIIKDFVWLKRDELPNKLQPEYYRKLSECLVDD